MLLIHGPDNFRSAEYLNQLKKEFIKKDDPQGLNLAVFDYAEENFKEFGIKQIISAVLNSSFFGTKKLIIIKNFFTNSSKKEQNRLINFLKKHKNLKSSSIIFYEKKQVRFPAKALEAKICSFNLLKPYEVVKWAQEKIKNKKGTIEPSALNQLCFKIGGNLAKMEMEIDKLLSYDQKITLKNVNLLTNARDEDNIFLLTDALAQRNKKQALKLLEDQLRLNQHPLYLLKMFAFAFRSLLIVKELLNQHLSQSSIQEKTRLHPYLIQKLISQAQKFNFLELKKIYLKLIDLDYAVKSGKIEPEKGLEIFITLL